MKKAKICLGTISILILVLACQPEPQPTALSTSTPTPIQAQALPTWTSVWPTWTPTSTPTRANTPTITPSPTRVPTLTPTAEQPEALPPPLPAAGPLPAVWTHLDFGLSAGDLYLPYSVAMDTSNDQLYALGQCDMPTLYTQPVKTCVSVLNLDTDQVERRVVIPGSAYAALKLIGDTLYVVERWSGDLYALDAETLSVTRTISDVIALDDDGTGTLYALTNNSVQRLEPDPISQLLDYPFEGYGNQPIDIAASPEYIYVLGYKALSVFDTELNQVSVIDLNDLSPRGLALDRANDRLYIATGTGLYTFEPDAEQIVLVYDEFPNVVQVLPDSERGQLILLVHTPNDWFGGQRIIVVDPSNSASSNSSSSNGTTVRTLFSALIGNLPALALDGARDRLLVASYANHSLISIPLEGAAAPAQRITPDPQRITLGIEVSDIALDETTDRLFVSDSSGQVRVLDRRSYAETARIYGGRYISLDPTHRRLYTGDGNAPTVRVFDADTLSLLREIPQAGRPYANPARDEVIIVERQFFVFDGATGEPRPNLLPGVGVPDAGCMGCYYTIATEAAVDTARGLTATITYTPWPGKPGPQESIVVDPLSGHAWYSLLTGGYIYQSSIDVYSDLSALQTRLRPAAKQPPSLPLRTLEGLSGDLAFDASVRRLYVARQNILFVLDSETLDRLGRVEVEGWQPVIRAIDGGLGRLYSAEESRLIVWTREGGTSPIPLPPLPAVLTHTIESILPSPNFVNDETLLAINEQRLCRSTDGGKTWHHLRGGLPSLPIYPLRLTAAFSPDYANDNTIWAGAYIGDSHGEGVWQSTDGGDTWQCSSSGLLDLRVYRLFPSPNFKNDRTLLAYARGRNGNVLYRSTNGSASWQLVLRQTGYEQPPLPHPEEMFYIEQPEPQFTCDYKGICQRSDDGSKTWQSFDTGGARLDSLAGYAVSPFFEGDRTIYFMTQSGLYRAALLPADTTLWERCTSSQFQNRDDYSRYLTALAIAQTGESTYDLFIGTAAGEFYRLSPNELEWESIAASRQVTPTPPPAPTSAATGEPPTPTPCVSEIDERLHTSYASLPQKLGCAVGAGITTTVAYQPFELGRMVWRADLRQIYVLQYDGTWASYNDTWDESQPDHDPDIVPPEYFFQPVRGFGKLWREQLGGVESELGWATAQEYGYDTAIQEFNYGLLLWSGEEHMLYVLYNDSTWDTASQEP